MKRLTAEQRKDPIRKSSSSRDLWTIKNFSARRDTVVNPNRIFFYCRICADSDEPLVTFDLSDSVTCAEYDRLKAHTIKPEHILAELANGGVNGDTSV